MAGDRRLWWRSAAAEPVANSARRLVVVTDIDDASAQIQLDGDSQRIEAATQVRHRTRDHDFCPHRRVGANSLYGLK